MRILAFDTSTRATAVALCDVGEAPLQRGEAPLALEARDDPPAGQRPGHATRLMPLVVELLDRAEISWDQLDRIAVGIGPGTFTGLRIGIATARALARARTIPLVGVSTLESLALGAVRGPRTEGGPDSDVVLAVLDARRREVFAAAWRLPSGGGTALGSQLLAPCAIAPAALAERLGELGGTPLTIGDGAVEFTEVLERSGAVVPEKDSELHRVTAINHCWLASLLRASAPDEIRPEYLRLPDAEIARRAADSR